MGGESIWIEVYKIPIGTRSRHRHDPGGGAVRIVGARLASASARRGIGLIYLPGA